MTVLAKETLILNSTSPLLEKLFHYVAPKGTYSQAILQSALNIEESELEPLIQELCALSNLFQYDEAQKSLVSVVGYQPLSNEKILKALPADLAEKIVVKNSFVTDSTNTDLEKVKLPVRQDVGDKTAAIAVTEMQQGGRGRRAKRWISPLAKNLYFSFKYHFPQSALPYLSILSLRSGIALLEALQVFGIEGAKVKWPNDIWVNGQKLAGILVESTVTSHGIDVIVGMGVNNQKDHFDEIVGNNPTNCETVLGKPLDRNLLIAELAKRLYCICQQITEAPESLLDLRSQWEKHSYFFGKTVRLISDSGEEIGQEIGIDESGALLIQYADGSIKSHLSGDLSLRAYQ